jgi:NAD(P)-dependent dehydrogenase (short-subunit alcohol dehydrogenase family)
LEATGFDQPGALLAGKVAVISGGAGSIGEATAQLFAEHGAHVVIADLDEDRSVAAVEAIRAIGGDAMSVVTDVRVQSDVDRLRDAVLAAHGRVDVLVNNAGHFVRQARGFMDEDPELWDELYRINLLHIFAMTRAFLPSMLDRRSGSIINVTSVEGLRGYPAGIVYGAFKAAAVQFTRSLGVQVAHHGVRVNGIGPDVTDALQVPYEKLVPADQWHLWPQWVPVGRVGVGRDQARVILFLASDLSGFVTGHTIPTDGGTGAAGGWFRSDRRAGGTGWTNRPIDP